MRIGTRKKEGKFEHGKNKLESLEEVEKVVEDNRKMKLRRKGER